MALADWLIGHEAETRLAAFGLVFMSLLVMERARPRRSVAGGWRRRTTNLALVAIDTAVLRLLFPLLVIDLAIVLQRNGIGLLHGLPPLPAVIIGVILLDLIIYWQHRLLHRIPLLWRLHRVHHADTSFDVSTGVRFHPLETSLSMGIKLAVVALLGITPLAVLIFELALSLGSLFTHANLRLPAGFERGLRKVFVTPEMHRVHHSRHSDETNSNFGFHLSIWDRLFGSYRDQPRDGHTRMVIGLDEYRSPAEQTLLGLLLNPFR